MSASSPIPPSSPEPPSKADMATLLFSPMTKRSGGKTISDRFMRESTSGGGIAIATDTRTNDMTPNNSSIFAPMQTHGVLLSHLKSLQPISSTIMTTHIMCKTIFCAMTEQDKLLSYAQVLQKKHPQLVNNLATTMVIHTHKELWCDLMDSLPIDEENPDRFVWIDCVSLSQHYPLDNTVSEFRSFFTDAIKSVEVVIAPCRNPISVRRTWCAFEICMAVKAGKQVILRAPPSSVAAFRKLVTNTTSSNMIAVLEEELSFFTTLHQQATDSYNCGNKQDYVAIIGTVRANPNIVTNLTAKFFVDTVLRADANNTTREKLSLLVARGLVQKITKDITAAEATFMQGLLYLKKKSVVDSTGNGMNDIAQLQMLLADTKFVSGEFDAALRLYQDLVTKSDHHDILFKTGICHMHLGHFKEAKSDLEKCASHRRQTLGDAHPLMADCVFAMGELSLLRNQPREAIPYFDEALAIRRSDAVVHPHAFGDCLYQMGELHRDLKEYVKSCEYFLQCVSVRTHVLGEEHVDTLAASSCYAAALLSAGKLDKARPLLYQVVDNSKRVLGVNSPNTATNICNLATLLHAQKELEEASRLFEQAIAIRKRILGDDAIEVAQAMNSLAFVLKEREMPGAAIGLGRIALEIAIKNQESTSTCIRAPFAERCAIKSVVVVAGVGYVYVVVHNTLAPITPFFLTPLSLSPSLLPFNRELTPVVKEEGHLSKLTPVVKRRDIFPKSTLL